MKSFSLVLFCLLLASTVAIVGCTRQAPTESASGTAADHEPCGDHVPDPAKADRTPIWANPQAPAIKRVGTFERMPVMIAYYKSQQFQGIMSALKAEHQKAQAAGDTARVAELERQGEALQDIAHRQLASELPLTNIIEALQPSLPDIAAEAEVDAIVEYSGDVEPGQTAVDVTALLIKRLPPAAPFAQTAPSAG